jgi:hypothetical protein
VHIWLSATHEGWQVPETQLSVGPQALPQAPQFELELKSDTHCPLQYVVSPGQVVVHLPLMQSSPWAQPW